LLPCKIHPQNVTFYYAFFLHTVQHYSTSLSPLVQNKTATMQYQAPYHVSYKFSVQPQQSGL